MRVSILKSINVLIALSFLILFCGEMDNPFDDPENVKIAITIPPRPDSYLWGVGDTVPAHLTVSYIKLVDSIIVLFGDKDSIMSDDTTFYCTSEIAEDTTLVVTYIFNTVGRKNIEAHVYIDGGEKTISHSEETEIGIKPIIDTLNTSGDEIAGAQFYLYVKSSGSPKLLFSWHKNNAPLPQDTADTLYFNPLQNSDSGSYFCVVKNSWGCDTSSTKSITIDPHYKITYNSNQATAGTVPVESNYFKEGALVTVLSNSGNLVKSGFTFAGWNTAANGSGKTYVAGETFAMPGADVILYAYWTTNPTYTVTYNGNGNSGGAVPVDGNNYESGASVTVLGNTGSLVKNGFTFIGWNTAANGSGIDYQAGATFSMGSANVVLFAKWTSNPTYKVIYEGNGNTSGSVPVDANNYEAGSIVTIKGNSGTLEKTGYIFSGWNTKADGSGTGYTVGADLIMGTANVTLFAQWTNNPTYTVIYDGNGNTAGTVPVDANNYEAGASVTVRGNVGNLVKTGSTFTGWNTAANGSGTGYAVGATFIIGSANVVLYAQWSANPTYTVTYNGNGSTGGTVPLDANKYEAGAIVTVKSNSGNLAKSGSTFIGWNTAADGSGTDYVAGDSFIMGSANVTLYARWTTNTTYAVTYDGNGNTSGTAPVDANKYESGATVTTKTNSGNLAKTGFTFVGWNTAADGSGNNHPAGATFTMGSANVTLYAQWSTNPTYKVTYNGNGNTGGNVPVDANNYETGATVTVKNNTGNLVKTGYTFNGWNTEADGSGTDYNGGSSYTMGTGAVVLFAKWTINQYTVTFNAQGGSTVTSQTINHGALAIEPADPTRTGYSFSGWYKETGCINAWNFGSDVVLANVTIFAKWTINQYTVAFNSQGGSAVTSQTVNHGAFATQPADPVRTGYTFGGWYKEAACTNTWNFGSDPVVSNVTIFAKWTINQYTVTFNSQGGSAITSQTVNHGAFASQPADPTRTGYAFGGWYKESACTNAWSFSSDAIVANTTIYAKWTINQFTVTFNSQGGSTVSPQTVNYGALATQPSDPTRTGYTFGGWYKESACTNAWNFGSDMVVANTTLYAKWTIIQYTVAFNSQGGSTVASQTVNHGAYATQPANPTRSGYTFGGWYKESACTNVWSFSSDAVVANVTIFAKWIQNFTITFNKNNATATGTMSPQSIASGSTANLTACGFAKNGYVFDGWATTSGGAVAYVNQAPYTMGSSNVTLYAVWVVMDIDGNRYTTVVINGRTYMKENLRTTKYNDGVSIPNITADASWASQTSGAYCWYDNNSSYKSSYGAMYNWYAVGTGKLAPQGWQVISQYEYRQLGIYCDPEWPGSLMDPDTAARALKEVGNAHWDNNNSSTNNRTGFSAFGAGQRFDDGAFNALRGVTYFWSLDQSSSTTGFAFQMTALDVWFYEASGNDKKSGMSVRCILVE